MLGYFKLYTLFVIISIVLILCRNDSDEIILEFKTMFNITCPKPVWQSWIAS